MTRFGVSEEELKQLQSGLYNANSVMQHLKTRLDNLDGTASSVRSLRTEVSKLSVALSGLVKELEDRRIL